MIKNIIGWTLVIAPLSIMAYIISGIIAQMGGYSLIACSIMLILFFGCIFTGIFILDGNKE